MKNTKDIMRIGRIVKTVATPGITAIPTSLPIRANAATSCGIPNNGSAKFCRKF